MNYPKIVSFCSDSSRNRTDLGFWMIVIISEGVLEDLTGLLPMAKFLLQVGDVCTIVFLLFYLLLMIYNVWLSAIRIPFRGTLYLNLGWLA